MFEKIVEKDGIIVKNIKLSYLRNVVVLKAKKCGSAEGQYEMVASQITVELIYYLMRHFPAVLK